MTRQKLLQLGWEVLIHLLYSQDIAPLDFHLFRSLQNSLNGKYFNSLEDCKRHLEQFFVQKDKRFWEDGIMKLPEKWQKVVGQRVNMLFNKVLGENEKCVFYFYRRNFLANPLHPNWFTLLKPSSFCLYPSISSMLPGPQHSTHQVTKDSGIKFAFFPPKCMLFTTPLYF